MKALNLSVPFEHNSHHYAGVAAHNGVTFDLIDAPCGADRQLVAFGNCDNIHPGVFFGMVSQLRMLTAMLARITCNYCQASK